jgi:hypothetical protein
MTHIIYLSIIAILILFNLKTLSVLGNKIKDHKKAYINFFKWIDRAGISKNIINVYEQMFKYDK